MQASTIEGPDRLSFYEQERRCNLSPGVFSRRGQTPSLGMVGSKCGKCSLQGSVIAIDPDLLS